MRKRGLRSVGWPLGTLCTPKSNTRNRNPASEKDAHLRGGGRCSARQPSGPQGPLAQSLTASSSTLLHISSPQHCTESTEGAAHHVWQLRLGVVALIIRSCVSGVSALVSVAYPL
eukprot:1700977-Rhodomonas_salina.1